MYKLVLQIEFQISTFNLVIEEDLNYDNSKVIIVIIMIENQYKTMSKKLPTICESQKKYLLHHALSSLITQNLYQVKT